MRLRGWTTMTDTTETAILAGGCFWGVQELLRQRDGVISTRVGYAGGDNENPTYANHPGHAETVEIVFDPARISYRDILEFFFQIHDPTTKDRQGNDIGSDYRSEIFYMSDEQRRVAERGDRGDGHGLARARGGQIAASRPRRGQVGEVAHRVPRDPGAQLARVTAGEGAEGSCAQRDVADALRADHHLRSGLARRAA